MIRNVLAVFGILAAVTAGSASALTVNGAGMVEGWNVTPFTQPNGEYQDDDLYSVRMNNYSPINYPGVGHLPSPGGTTGEKFDLEEMHVRHDGSIVQMLLVLSSPMQAVASGTTYSLGDILLDIDGDELFDLGMVSQTGNAGLLAGGLYDINELKRLQNIPGSYRDHALEAEIGPWAVKTGTLLGQTAIESATHSYGGAENNTWLYQYTFDLTAAGGMPLSLGFHLVWGCGNDVIEGTYYPPIIPPNDPPVSAMPEPATALLGGLGLAAIWSRTKRRR